MGTENFYPPNARYLFSQYLNLISVLIENINDNLANLLPPLPEQTEEERILLLPPLPEETEEERIYFLSLPEETKSLEVEDYMEDVQG